MTKGSKTSKMAASTNETIFSNEDYSREGLADLLSSVPQGSADGAELQGWNDKMFVDRFLPAQKLDLPTIISLKSCCFNVIHMLCGQHAYYEGAVSDMKTIILSMRHPNKKDEFLFEYILSGSTYAIGTEKETYVETDIQPVTTGYFAEEASPIEASNEPSSILAGEVATTTRSGDIGAIMPDQVTTRENIGEFWTTLYDMTKNLTSQGETNALNEKTLISVLGFVCLHTLKLITREVRSVQSSMSLRMSAQYAAIYKNTSFTRKIVAPCVNALRDLKTAYLNKQISLDLLSILIGRNMIERAEPIPDDNIFGILHGTCLLHVSMYGLAPIKYFEQAAKALGMKNSEFASLICTSLVKKSIVDISHMLIYANKSHTVKIYEKSYTLASQSTWRYARLYNANYFNRFITTKNARIVIRCAAYVAVHESSSQIDQMNILQGHTNKAIFLKEKERAEEHARNQISQNDAPLTKDAETIYKQKEIITSSAFNMNE